MFTFDSSIQGIGFFFLDVSEGNNCNGRISPKLFEISKNRFEFSSKSLMEHGRVCDGNMENLYSNRITKRQKSGVRFRSCTRTT